MPNPYKEELNLIDLTDKYPISVQVRGTGQQTKWMALNKESISALETFLKELKETIKE